MGGHVKAPAPSGDRCGTPSVRFSEAPRRIASTARTLSQGCLWPFGGKVRSIHLSGEFQNKPTHVPTSESRCPQKKARPYLRKQVLFTVPLHMRKQLLARAEFHFCGCRITIEAMAFAAFHVCTSRIKKTRFSGRRRGVML